MLHGVGELIVWEPGVQLHKQKTPNQPIVLEPISHPSQSKLLRTGWIEINSVFQVTSIRFPHADDTHSIILNASSETQGQSVRRKSATKVFSLFKHGRRALPPMLENFCCAFSPGPTGSPRMDSTRLKERLRGTLRRRLEVVGEIENGRARGRHVSPSGAPVFSCAHYFQAPATQATK